MQETDLGGQESAFPSTAWSDVAVLGTAAGEAARLATARLLESYWRPIYITLRRAWGESVEDAKDMTQEFMTRLLERGLAHEFDPSRGRFRSWLKAALRHFQLQSRRDRQALKRRAPGRLLSLEGLKEAASIEIPAKEGQEDPGKTFDREWAKEVHRRALGDLKTRLYSEGKGRVYEAFVSHDVEAPSSGPPNYQELAESLGLSVFDVGNHLKSARAALREAVSVVVGGYARSLDEVRVEIRELLEGDGG